MRQHPARFAASLSAAAAAVIVVIVWATAGSGLAMAAVVSQLQAHSYRFVIELREAGEDTQTLRAMVMEPGRLRIEQNGDAGSFVSILDSGAQQSLMIMPRQKIAYRIDFTRADTPQPLGFLMFPGRSALNLWSLRTGNETDLGKQRIDDRAAQGFRVVNKQEDYTETIDVWADVKTAEPLRVEVMWNSAENADQSIHMTFRDFEVMKHPNPAQFSLKAPEGYQLANWQTLEQLNTESVDTEVETAPAATSSEAEKVLSALALWRDGKSEEAVDTLSNVNWSAELYFGREHHLFTMTEADFVTLVAADRQAVMTGVLEQLSDCRDLARALKEQVHLAHDNGQHAQALAHLDTALSFGHLLNGEGEALVVVRLVGYAITNMALKERLLIFDTTGQTDNAAETQRQIQAINDELETLRESATPH